jgi:PPM family protein phosphatase
MVALLAAALTDTGSLREENEDSVWSQIYSSSNRPTIGLFIVCDGMGGHMGGKYASYWAVEAIKSEFADLFISKDPRATLILSDEDIEKAQRGEMPALRGEQPPDIEQRIRSAIQKANHVVFQYAAHKPDHAANAGTTITMMVVYGDQAIIANIGDSRTYLLRDGEMTQVTRDHSLVASLVAEGHILPNEIYTHPQRNVIYRFLGQKGQAQPDLYFEQLQPDDVFLLCSDGLWEMVRKKQVMIDLISRPLPLIEICQDLVETANTAGGEDNISIIIVKAA